MALPVLTTIDDVRQLVGYLKNKPTGATVAEIKAALGKVVVDGRKLSAYQTWGVAAKDGDRFKLSTRGWELARKPTEEQQTFKQVLDSIVPYRSVAEWIFHQNMDTVSNVDVAVHWHENHAETVGTDNENTLKDGAVGFFHVAQAAGLGTLKIGRKGQPTRLIVDKAKLRSYIEAGPSTPPLVKPSESLESQQERSNEEPPKTTKASDAEPRPGTPAASGPKQLEAKPEATELTVFISHGSNTDIAEQVQTLVELADIKTEIAVKEETTAIPVPEKVFSAMRRCHAGIIVVSVDETRKDAKGNYTLNENVLIEIGAAFVLYDRRVILLWDKRLKVPSNLQGLYRCEYEGDELAMSAGMKLMKAVKEFKGQKS
jgi:predicted nucleotide-binding protein